MHPEPQVIESLTQQIVEAVHSLRTVLFGSAAHGKAEPGSAIDLLIVVPAGTHRGRTAQLLYRTINGIRGPLTWSLPCQSIYRNTPITRASFTTALPARERPSMSHPLPEPGTPADWLHTRSDLAVAQSPASSDMLLETFCFHVQQAAEKRLKAGLIHLGIPIPRTHNLKTLMQLLPSTCPVPPSVAAGASLTDYAVTSRYPDDYEIVNEEEYREAVELARRVVAWVEEITGSCSPP